MNAEFEYRLKMFKKLDQQRSMLEKYGVLSQKQRLLKNRKEKLNKLNNLENE